MVYLSLALILLGIVIFLYSIILDTKKRREGRVPPGLAEPASPGGAKRLPRKEAASENRKAYGPESPDAGAKRSTRSTEGCTGGENVHQAVLFEDSSHIIDYSNESGSIDSSLQGYKNIKRIGSGRIAVEKGGVTFFMGKKLYRYDFHRLNDLKKGSSHLALFLRGSKAVRLFIVEPGSEIINTVHDAYREYLRSSA